MADTSFTGLVATHGPVTSASTVFGRPPAGFLSVKGLRIVGAYATRDETLHAAEHHLTRGGAGPVMIHTDDAGGYVIFAPLDEDR